MAGAAASSAQSSYYDVLGVAVNASVRDVRRAYKALALKLHPDKNASTDAAAQFRRVREAYEVLSDPQKRQWYDAAQRNSFNIDWKFILRVAKDLCDRSKRTVHVSVPVTIDDLYHARIKRLDVNVKRFNTSAQRLETRTEAVYISLCSHQRSYTFQGKGDDCAVPCFPAGDLVVALDVQPHPRLHIDDLFCKYDLYTDLEVSLHQYYLQQEFEVVMPDGATVIISAQPDTCKVVVVKGKGLPYVQEDVDGSSSGSAGETLRGDLYVHFNLVLPTRQELLPSSETHRSAQLREMLHLHFAPHAQRKLKND